MDTWIMRRPGEGYSEWWERTQAASGRAAGAFIAMLQRASTDIGRALAQGVVRGLVEAPDKSLRQRLDALDEAKREEGRHDAHG